jgi:hypothetical protein
MSNIITITLGRSRTKEQAFSDAALVNGYQPTITQVTTGVESCTIAEYQAAGSPTALLASRNIAGVRADASRVSLADGVELVRVNYEIETQLDNPVSEQQFGAQIYTAICDTLDRNAAIIAAELRDQLAGETMPTTVA